jgi:hypothetical protein
MYTWTNDVDDGLFAMRGTVPAGTTALAIAIGHTVPTSGTSTTEWGELTVRNLTALSIA